MPDAAKPSIRYRSGYKYQLTTPHEHLLTTFAVPEDVGNEYVWLSGNALCISAGYAWDGASGPTFDTKDSMRGSLVHDALYQLIREKLLPATEENYKFANEELHRCLREDGMGRVRAWMWLTAVSKFGRGHNKTKPEQTAP